VQTQLLTETFQSLAERKTMAKKEKCYVVVSADKKYVHGAFKFSPEGEKEAKKYARALKKQGGEYLVVEK